MRQYKEQSYISLYNASKRAFLPVLTQEQVDRLLKLHRGCVSCVFQTASEIINQTLPRINGSFKTSKNRNEYKDDHWASNKSRRAARSLLNRTIICTVVYYDGRTLIGSYVRPEGERLRQRHYVLAIWNALESQVMS